MASVDPTRLTPTQRLAISRRALVKQLNGGSAPRDEVRLDPEAEEFEYAHRGSATAHARDALSGRGRTVWTDVALSMAQRWWRRHPAHAVGQLARPVLEHYARKEPAKLIAVAAATGAVLVLVKPWRLLSLTAVLAAVLKTSDVADIVNTLMQKTQSPPRKDPP
jgi:hypothetical protein